jgi:hypothetical protein
MGVTKDILDSVEKALGIGDPLDITPDAKKLAESKNPPVKRTKRVPVQEPKSSKIPLVPKPNARKYNFPVPIVISAFKANFVPGILKDDGLWDHCPADIQALFENHGNDDVTITKAMLDEIDNETWAKLKVRFAQMG